MIVKQSTKNLLAESLKELAKKKSVDKITIKEIAQNCGLTAQTFYNHFRDKYDLIAWIYSTDVEKIMNRIDGENYEWKNALSDAMKYFLENRIFLKNLIANTAGQNSFINYAAQFNIKILSDYIKRNQNIEDLPAATEIFIKIYCYGTVCTFCEYLTKDFSMPEENFVKLIEKSLPEPLKKYLYKNAEI